RSAPTKRRSKRPWRLVSPSMASLEAIFEMASRLAKFDEYNAAALATNLAANPSGAIDPIKSGAPHAPAP
ncbi:MAG: hypothetical protein EBZ48_09715, partial [Proteobacteria bacterium]|nr:hypothetical protein [Pseudomonadota bacterium]